MCITDATSVVLPLKEIGAQTRAALYKLRILETGDQSIMKKLFKNITAATLVDMAGTGTIMKKQSL